MTVVCLGQGELRREHGGGSIPAQRYRYQYTSPADIAGSLAQFDRYTADVYIPADGQRRFVPREEDGRDGYIARAFQIGHSLLTRDRGWSKATFDDYLLGKLAYDWLCHARERLAPRNLTAEELVTPGRLRRDLLRRDALPDELTDGEGESGGSERINQIVAAGVSAAAARGIEQPTETEIMALGLMETTAGRPPLAAQPDQLILLVREALFDFTANEQAIAPDVWNEIGEQFEAAVRNRLDISQERFNSWLYGKRAYMLQTVNKGAELPKTDDRRALVRSAMLHEAWAGFTMVNECLDAFAQAFERALTRPLNDTERKLFRGMYRRQPYFGNFVLPLLLDAQDLVRHAVLDLWDDADRVETIEVFQRMLLYRSQIIPRVREIQRRTRAKGAPLLESSSDEGQTNPQESLWAELTGHILEQRDITCPHCDLPPVCTLIHAKLERQPVTLEVGCSTHGRLRQLKITQDDLTAARDALYGESVSEEGGDRASVASARSI